MGKRTAERQITDRDADADLSDEDHLASGEFKQANPAELGKRQIRGLPGARKSAATPVKSSPSPQNHYVSLRGLNVSLQQSIQSLIDKDCFVDLAPHLDQLKSAYSSKRAEILKSAPLPSTASTETPAAASNGPSLPKAPTASFTFAGKPITAAPSSKEAAPAGSFKFEPPSKPADSPFSLPQSKPAEQPKETPKPFSGFAFTAPSAKPAEVKPTEPAAEKKEEAPKPFSGFAFTKPAASDEAKTNKAAVPNAFSAAPASTSSPFSFGAGSSAPSFSFGSSGGAKPSAGVGFTFGTPPAANTASPFTFGAPSSTTAAVAKEETKPDEETSDEPPQVSENPFTSTVGAGEEDEVTLHEARTRIYKLEDGENGKKEYKTVGVSILKLKKNEKTGKVRLIGRTDPSGAVTMNFGLFSSLALTQNGNTINFIGFDGDKMTPYRLQIKTAELAKEFVGKVAEQVSKLG